LKARKKKDDALKEKKPIQKRSVPIGARGQGDQRGKEELLKPPSELKTQERVNQGQMTMKQRHLHWSMATRLHATKKKVFVLMKLNLTEKGERKNGVRVRLVLRRFTGFENRYRH